MTKDKNYNKWISRIWAVLRILIALVLLWAFADKLVGLGYSTCRSVDPATKEETVQVLCEKSVLQGASPTTGFLSFGVKGPMQGVYSSLAGNVFVDVLFMAGLGLIGLALLLGIGIKVAVVSGIIFLLMLWSAVLPGTNNPILDEHIIYAVALLGVLATNQNQAWGLGKWWQKQALVKRFPLFA